jgi:hypothetical protein
MVVNIFVIVAQYSVAFSRGRMVLFELGKLGLLTALWLCMVCDQAYGPWLGDKRFEHNEKLRWVKSLGKTMDVAYGFGILM